jgi:exodeoxyribonuclease-5
MGDLMEEDREDWRLELDEIQSSMPPPLPEVVDNRSDAEKARDKLISQDTGKSTRKEVILSEEQQELRDEIDRFIADPFQGDYFHYEGLAGTGKTVVLSETARENGDCSLVALSGKAASLLRAKSGTSASTIHAAIYKLVNSRDLQNGKRIMEWRRANKDGLLNGITFLLDEKSMINREIAHDILATGARIVAAGDPGQLPPVRGSQFFADSPNFTLKTVHRQALESPIIRQAHRVRSGLPYEADGDDFRVVDRMPKEDLVNADMVLVWKNATRVEMTRITRRYRGLAGKVPQPGEPVMCLKNAADFNVYNGATYTLLKPFEPGDSCIQIEMDGEPLDIPNVKFEGMPDTIPAGQVAVTDFTFGYVYTVHKAQGSEADNVVLIDEYAMQEHAIAWRYTAITRAAKRLTVVRW